MSGPHLATHSDVPPGVIPNPKSVEGSAAWILKPLNCVGSTTAKLTTAASGLDVVTKAGSKSQSHTSWDCASRSFLLSYYYSGVGAARPRARRAVEGREDGLPEPDVPGEEEMEEWTDVETDMYEEGRKMFYRGVGLVTKEQVKQEKYIRAILQNSAHNREKRQDKAVIDSDYTIPSSGAAVYARYVSLTHEQCQFVADWYSEGGVEDLNTDPVVLCKYVVNHQPIPGRDFFLLACDQSLPPGVTSGNVTNTTKCGFVTVSYSRKPTVISTYTWQYLDSLVRQNVTTLKRKTKEQVRVVRSFRYQSTPLARETNEGMNAPDEDIDVQFQPGTSSAQRVEGEGPRLEAGMDAGDVEELKYWYSDTIPVRCLGVSVLKADYEAGQAVPYSAQYLAIINRLTNPEAAGAMSSMSKGVSIRDSASVLAFARGFSTTSSNSLFEVAPLVRMMCMAMSVSEECYRTEIIMYRVIRGWTMVIRVVDK